jgi:hypothetical protein
MRGVHFHMQQPAGAERQAHLPGVSRRPLQDAIVGRDSERLKDG